MSIQTVKKDSHRKKRIALISTIVLVSVLGLGAYVYSTLFNEMPKSSVTSIQKDVNDNMVLDENKNANPLFGKQLYVDQQSEIKDLVSKKTSEGNSADAEILNKIATQPQALWLTGPTLEDPNATKDINLITRTSTEAGEQNKLPVYKLYAIPNRDACAGYSKNTATDNVAYLKWLDTLLSSLRSEAVFLIEADAIAHAVDGSCMSEQQKDERYDLLNQVSTKLGGHDKVIAAYLDAGHSEWFPNNDVLIEPLKRAGIDKIRGVVLNVSFFESVEAIQPWAESLVSKLGVGKAAIIDTSRNGNGAPPANVTGEDRWCNPVGVGLGKNPTVNTGSSQLDAFLWVKRPGESDGDCRNNPPPGKLSEAIVRVLVSNTQSN